MVNEVIGHAGIERHLGACRFVSRRDYRGVSTHRMHHSVESHGGILRLDFASANAPSETQRRAEVVCLAFCSCAFFEDLQFYKGVSVGRLVGWSRIK